jgi:hypothetical protein
LADLEPILSVLRRARRRLRLMAALDAATSTAILVVAGSLVVLWLRRMEWITDREGVIATAGLLALIAAAALLAALRRLPAKQVATRVDRASGLADRLGTACDFSERLARADAELHPETRAFMQAAIADGVAAAPRADVRRAAPFRAPRDARALAAFTAVAAVIALLRFGPTADAALAGRAPGAERPRAAVPPEEKERLDPDDLEYQRQFVEDMKQLAVDTQDQMLFDMARELEALLAKAEKGELSKQELIEKMEAAEAKYTRGNRQDLDAQLAELEKQGKQLKKQPLTRKLGEAMEKGDLAEAQKELERLAEKLEKEQLSPEQQKQLADALEKAAENQEQRDQQQEAREEQQAQRQIDKKKEEIRRLEKKLEEQPQDEQAKRTLNKEKRELERLERENEERKKERQQRQLARLTRNMRDAAEDLKRKNQRQSAQNMRRAADETRKMQNEQRRQGNQKQVQSQLSDLKEAIRRAKPRKGQGRSGQQQARMQRIQEWQQRAGGRRGNAQAWRGQGQQGEPQGKEGQLGQGKNQQQSQWGDEHDPNLTSDPTDRYGKTRNEQLTGVHGQGPSRRETILTSAKKGFAQQGYKQVYTDYRKAAEEVMTKEKVPQGYKYYVKRYFQRIKPHNMD